MLERLCAGLGDGVRLSTLSIVRQVDLGSPFRILPLGGTTLRDALQ